MSMHRLSALSLSLASGVLFSSLHTAPIAAQTVASTLITSCVSKLSGVSRIVAAPTACNANLENVVQWNEQGPAGPNGTTGPMGSPGLRGPIGPVGATGAQGPAGPTGATGAPGLNYAGNWSPFGNWKKNDVVGFQGSSYLAIIDDPVGVFQPTSNQGAAIWNILAAQGATGAQGVAGPMGPQGVAGATGPTGPQGPAGPSSTLAYTVHFYSSTVTVPGGNIFGDPTTFQGYAACPASERAMSASCGYQYPFNTYDQHNLILNYEGINPNNGNGSLCLFSNTATDARNTTVGVSCLAPADTTKSAAQVIKSCTYDPDTQTPCTEADATVFDPVADKAQALARVSALNAAGPAVSSTNGAQKVKRSVTLWFRD